MRSFAVAVLALANQCYARSQIFPTAVTFSNLDSIACRCHIIRFASKCFAVFSQYEVPQIWAQLAFFLSITVYLTKIAPKFVYIFSVDKVPVLGGFVLLTSPFYLGLFNELSYDHLDSSELTYTYMGKIDWWLSVTKHNRAQTICRVNCILFSLR